MPILHRQIYFHSRFIVIHKKISTEQSHRLTIHSLAMATSTWQQQYAFSLSSGVTRLPSVVNQRRTSPLQIPRHRFSVVRADFRGDRRSGDTESKEVLEAFFVGKALAEAVTERLGTVVGEFLSDVGRWQAEQQTQVRNFQEEVQERAKKAKGKALQEAKTVTSYNGAPTSSKRDITVPPESSSSQSNMFQDSSEF